MYILPKRFAKWAEHEYIDAAVCVAVANGHVVSVRVASKFDFSHYNKRQVTRNGTERHLSLPIGEFDGHSGQREDLTIGLEARQLPKLKLAIAVEIDTTKNDQNIEKRLLVAHALLTWTLKVNV